MEDDSKKEYSCLYCKDMGYFSDCLTGGESYCTCINGHALKLLEAIDNKTDQK